MASSVYRVSRRLAYWTGKVTRTFHDVYMASLTKVRWFGFLVLFLSADKGGSKKGMLIMDFETVRRGVNLIRVGV